MSRKTDKVRNDDLHRVAGIVLAEIDELAARDITADVADLPLVVMFVDAYCPAHNLAEERSAYIAPWAMMAVLAGQIDYFAAAKLDAGQRERFQGLRDATLAAAKGGE